MNKFFIGIDLGGTRVKSGLLSNNILLEKTIFDVDSDKGLLSNLPRLEMAIDELLKKYEVKPGLLEGIGLAFPGIVDPLSKKIISTNKKYDDGPGLNLEKWAAQKWNAPLYIENDARMTVVGEWIFGAGRGSNDIVAVTIGTGIGSSAIIEGRLLRGKHFQAVGWAATSLFNTMEIPVPVVI